MESLRDSLQNVAGTCVECIQDLLAMLLLLCFLLLTLCLNSVRGCAVEHQGKERLCGTCEWHFDQASAIFRCNMHGSALIDALLYMLRRVEVQKFIAGLEVQEGRRE